MRRETRLSIESQKIRGQSHCGVPAIAAMIVRSWKRQSGELVTPYDSRKVHESRTPI